MPAKPLWFSQLPEIIATVSALRTPVLDRAICEEVFGLRRRQTISTMQRFGGYRIGNATLLDRGELLRRLEELQEEPEVQRERDRKQTLADRLAELHRYRRAARIAIRPISDVGSSGRPAFPEGVRFNQGQLIVEFQCVEDLLAHLYELAKVAAADFDAFSARANL